VLERRKRASMNRRGTQLANNLAVRRGGIALVLFESVGGIELVVGVHESIARDLGQDGRRGNAVFASIAPDHRFGGTRHALWDAIAVHECVKLRRRRLFLFVVDCLSTLPFFGGSTISVTITADHVATRMRDARTALERVLMHILLLGVVLARLLNLAVGSQGQRLGHQPHTQQRALQNVDFVNLGRVNHRDRPGRRCHNLLVQGFPRAFRYDFAVVHAGNHHRQCFAAAAAATGHGVTYGRHHHRTRQRTASGFVNAEHVPDVGMGPLAGLFQRPG